MNHFTEVKFYIVLCSLLALSTAVYGAESIPLKNAGFEHSNNNHNQPLGWKSGSTFSIDTGKAHSGRSSLKLHRTNSKQPRVCSQDVHLIPGKVYQLTAWIKTKDIHGKGARIGIQLYEKDHKFLGGTYSTSNKSSTKWIKIQTDKLRVPKKATGANIVCYLYPKATGTAWFDDVSLRMIPQPDMSTVLAYPNYRGRIRPENDQPIKVTGRISNEAQQADYVTVALVNPTGIVITSTRQSVHAGDNFTLKLPIKSNVNSGKYGLNVILHNASSKKPQQIKTYPIHILDTNALKPTVWIDSHNRLIVHGQPMMPIGLYDYLKLPDNIRILQGTPFNCIMPYAGPMPKDKKSPWRVNSNKYQPMTTPSVLDTAEKAGIYVIASIKDLYYRHAHLNNKSRVQTIVRSIIGTLRNKPALLAWYTNDELGTQWLPLLKKHYHWITEMDPNHPAYMVIALPNKVKEYINAFDVIGTDRYPIGRHPIAQVSESTQTTVDQVNNARPVWEVLQSYNLKVHYGAKKYPKATTPSPTELRNMIWQAVTHGANGVLLFSLDNMQRNPDRPFKTYWPKVKKIAAELNQWAPVLLSIKKSPEIKQYEISNKDSSWLSVRIANWHGRTFVFACNNTRKEQTARFSIDSDINLSHVRAIDVLNNKHKDIKTKGNMWQDTFKPLAVKMYELNGTGKKLPPPQDVHPPKAK